jgi:hypothetical protein
VFFEKNGLGLLLDLILILILIFTLLWCDILNHFFYMLFAKF